jgi:magnesium-transporting ATPase (P-type)
VAALLAVPEVRSVHSCGANITFIFSYHYHYVIIFDLLLTCVIPLCLIAFSYIMSYRHLVKNSGALSEGTKNPQLNTRKITAKDLLGLIIVFLISYLPYHIFENFYYFSFTSDISGATIKGKIDWDSNILYIDTITYNLLLIISRLNPVAMFHNSLAFRSHFKRYLTCCCKTNSHPTDFELTRRN